MAYVGELQGALAGHVTVGTALEDDTGAAFRRRTGCTDPAVVSVLFTADWARGRGLGGLLLDTAVQWARAAGRVPVLDVLPSHSTALAVYQHRGWVEVGRARFPWLPDDEPDVRLLALPPFDAAGPP